MPDDASRAAPSFLGEAAKFDLGGVQIVAAFVCASAVALCLGGGLAFGAPSAGMVATTGALSTGFGAPHRLFRVPGLAMALAAIGMGVSAFLGAALAGSTLLSVLGGAAVAMICASLTSFGLPFWWFTLQWAVAFFLATSPVPGQTPWERGALVLAGGVLQCAIVFSWWRWRPFGAASEPDPAPLSAALPAVAGLVSGVGGWHARYAVGAGVMAAAALLIERELGVANGYWAPMTALIILKPQRRDTFARIAQRILGTLAGSGAATLVAATLRPNNAELALAAVILAWATYALQRVNYAVFSFGITAAVVCLLSMTGLPEIEVAWRRIIATLIGAALAALAGVAVGEDARPPDLSRAPHPNT